MSEWKEYKLGELIVHKKGFAFKSDTYKKDGTPVVRVSDTTDNSININSCYKVDYSVAQELSAYQIKTGDLVIATVGSWADNPKSVVGKVIRVPVEANNALLNQNAVRLRAINLNFQDFLYYNLKSKTFSDYLLAAAQGSANQASISLVDIFNFRIALPNEKETLAIASVLGSLDNKIDLLHRQNQTLEAMAEMLFRQWFIEEAEESWEKGKLGDYIQTTSGGTPSRANVNFYENGNTRWVKSKELDGTFIFDTEEKITEEAVKKSSAKLIPANAILIAMYGATIGQFGILAKPATCNQAICALIPNEQYPYSFLHIFIKSNKEYIESLAMGSAQQNISQVIIKDINILIPNDKILQFHKTVEPSFLKIKANISQINTITQLRDTLLPKLMSGQVQVSEK